MSRLSDYDLLEVIGEGASGVVYRARHRTLDRLVALKLLRDRTADAASQARSHQEARLAASLDHPHVVPLYEVGQDDGRFFLVMKLIEGADLKASADAMRPDPRKVAQVMASVARAVQHAHERGVLHRDLKTANILMDADGQPHLIDFGLARPLEGEAVLTATSVIVGTPAYLSPEQAAGCKEIGPATDIWALGVVLHELLTGKLPFEGGSTYAVLLAIQNSPVALSGRASTDLERICLRCLQKKPADRYSSAADLAEDLERVSEGKRLNRPWYERGATFLRRWWPGVAAAGVLGLFAIVFWTLLGPTDPMPLPKPGLDHLRGYLDNVPKRDNGGVYVEDNELKAVVAKLTDDDLAGLIKNGLVHQSIFVRRRASDEAYNSGRSVNDYSLTPDEQLVSLDLCGTQITSAGLQHLARLRKLKHLKLDAGQVTDEVLKVLHKNGQLHALFSLRREVRGESDEGIVSLDLGNTNITDVGLKHLTDLRDLQRLYLTNTKVTSAAVKELQSALPGCHIDVGR